MIRKMLDFASHKYPFGGDDFFQQLMGSMLLSGPFVFTQEIWQLAAGMSGIQAFCMLLLSAALGYGVLYVASQDRDWELERKVFGLTLRYVSLLTVSMISVVMLIGLTSAASTFGASFFGMLKAMTVFSIFSIIGAATADNLI
jgi:uncharacterized membrane protein